MTYTFRKIIYAKVSKILANFTNIDLEAIFNLYDAQLFEGQIFDKMLTDNITVSFDGELPSVQNVSFRLVEKRWCDLIYTTNSKGDIYHINFTISDWTIARILYGTSEERVKIFGESDKIECFLISFEHQLSHLLFLLWGYSHKYASENDLDRENANDIQSIYGIHGKLYGCSTKTFFDKLVQQTILNLSNPKNLDTNVPEISARYKYWKNSCNLDSLNMLLFVCTSTAFRDIIFSTNVNSVYYNPSSVSVICKNGSDIQNVKDLRSFINRLQYALFYDFNAIRSPSKNGDNDGGGLIKCTNIRHILYECLTDMKIDNEWEFYNVGEIYDLYTDLFPSLKLSNFPVNRNLPGIVEKSTTTQAVSFFTFWDFLYTESPENIEDISAPFTTIDWDSMDLPFLVFKNAAVPAVKNFGSFISETVKDPYSGEKSVCTKHRIFDEYILDGKYEMVGAIVLEGVKPGEEGGIHYHACIKTTSLGWIYYDDMKNTLLKYTKFPRKVLFERDREKPEMYFYAKKS